MDTTYLFYEKNKANERTNNLIVSDHRRPRLRVTPEEQQVHCRPFKVEIEALFEDIQVI